MQGPGACSSECPQSLMRINPNKTSIQFSGANETQRRQATHPRTHSQKAVEMSLDPTHRHLHESQPTALSKGILACSASSQRCNCRQDPVASGDLTVPDSARCPQDTRHGGWGVELRPRQPAQHRVCALVQGTGRNREAGTGLVHLDLLWSLNLGVQTRKRV